MSRRLIDRALAVAHIPRRRFSEFLSAYRDGGVAAVAALDPRVGRAIEIEVRYGRRGVKLDPRAMWAEEREAASRDD